MLCCNMNELSSRSTRNVESLSLSVYYERYAVSRAGNNRTEWKKNLNFRQNLNFRRQCICPLLYQLIRHFWSTSSACNKFISSLCLRSSITCLFCMILLIPNFELVIMAIFVMQGKTQFLSAGYAEKKNYFCKFFIEHHQPVE